MPPPNPWSRESVIIPGSAFGTQYKPAACDFDGRLFLAWAGSQDSSCFYFTHRLPSDDGWASPTAVQFDDSLQYQSATSALVVFNNVLYAFVPWTSANSQGLAIFSFDNSTFQHAGDWGTTWSKAVAAVVCDDTLHVVASNPDGSDHLVWTWSNPGLTAITGPSGFSANTSINESTTSNPALIVRAGKVVLLILANTDGRTVLESTLTMGDSPTWNRSDTLNECGNSGVSAAATPDGEHAWICFKKHNGSSNLICHYKNRQSAWSGNYSMGGGDRTEGLNEAALVFSNDWLYAIWNTYQSGAPIYYSRRPVKQLMTDSWMGELVNQDVSISALSIPGTHDSASTYYRETMYRAPWVRCQNMSIASQLNAGIRYFDIRTGYNTESGQMNAFHGSDDCGVAITDIFQFMYDWLQAHQTEGIIVQIKNDQDGSAAGDQRLSNDLYNMIYSNPLWNFQDTTPTLADIRGKIQLVRRFPRPDPLDNTNKAFGINATSWPQNKTGLIANQTQESVFAKMSPPVTVPLFVEDLYEIDGPGSPAVVKKIQTTENFINQATGKAATPANVPDNTWYIGYSSFMTDGGFHPSVSPISISSIAGLIGSAISIPNTPQNYAAASIGGQTPLNTTLEEYVLSKGRFGEPACVGTLVMDCPERPTGTLIESIIYTNNLRRV